MNNTAVIYSRVSSLGERQSNERQIEDLKILAKQKNYTIEKIYEEKISGAKKNVERPILTECLEYCFSKNIRILLISELSRLGRNVDEVLKMLCYVRRTTLMYIFIKRPLAYLTIQVRNTLFSQSS
jgi:DNA invertase Pin-like site-specific DNA recombinase